MKNYKAICEVNVTKREVDNEMIKRYHMYVDDIHIDCYMEEAVDGEYVTYKDYAELENNLKIAKKALIKIAKDFGSDYCDGNTMIAKEALEKLKEG
jgi:hypothetical protein